MTRGFDPLTASAARLTPLPAFAPQARYLRIFSFLWRLKRVEHALAATWQARHAE